MFCFGGRRSGWHVSNSPIGQQHRCASGVAHEKHHAQHVVTVNDPVSIKEAGYVLDGGSETCTGICFDRFLSPPCGIFQQVRGGIRST